MTIPRHSCVDDPPDCYDCGNPDTEGQVCGNSQKSCKHHCNHSWTHDVCCWCGTEWGEGGEEVVRPLV